MELIFLTAFILGSIVGSFLNVVILRYGGSLSGRSHCPHCKRMLTTRDLVPIFSFLFLKGNCRTCKKKISTQYPLVEVLTGFVFTLIVFHFGFSFEVFSRILIHSIIWSILIVITVYDLRHLIIPDELAFLFALLSLIDVWLSGTSLLPHIFAGLVFFIPFWALWFFSKGRWMGLGDGKLAIGIGFLLGLNSGISALVLAVWIGAAVSLLTMFLQKYASKLLPTSASLTMKSEIPLGPFLILGVALVFFGGLAVYPPILF
ncbi:MAG: prepilin peptidase [Patescibacteria group bacterium]